MSKICIRQSAQFTSGMPQIGGSPYFMQNAQPQTEAFLDRNRDR